MRQLKNGGENGVMTESAIYCAACNENVKAYLVPGSHVLPNQSRLSDYSFWQCPDCNNFVGTHKIKKNDFAPLGPISSKKMRVMQKTIRDRINLICKSKNDVLDVREKLYNWLGKKLYLSNYRIELTISKTTFQETMKLLDLIK